MEGESGRRLFLDPSTSTSELRDERGLAAVELGARRRAVGYLRWDCIWPPLGMATRSRADSAVPQEIRDAILGAATSTAAAMAAGASEPAVWTPEEQTALERCLTAMDPGHSTLRRAALVASELPGKSLRDVVQRISALQDCMPEATAAAAAVSSATALQAGLSSSGVAYDALGNPNFQVSVGAVLTSGEA